MPRAPLCVLSLLLPSLYPILLPPQAAVGAASQPRAPGLAGRLGAGWPAAGDPRVTFASPPCQFTELPFPINVTAGESRRIIDGEGGGFKGGQRDEEPAGGGGGSARLLWIFKEARPFLCGEGYFWESVFL